MAFDNLLLERDGAIAVVTVNRPKVLNALNAVTIAELGRAFAELKTDDTVRVVILTGAGEKSFVAGADISELAAQTGASAQATALAGQAAFAQIEHLGKPVIAAVNGFALGGGCELSMACHIRLASEHALFGQPEINLGIIPGFAGSQRLPRIVGRSKALEMLLGGDPIKADEALRIGLVSTVLPAAELLPKAMELAAKFAAKAPVARRYILDCVVRGASMPFADAQKVEADLFGLVGATEDVRAGLGAFLDRTTAVWQGR